MGRLEFTSADPTVRDSAHPSPHRTLTLNPLILNHIQWTVSSNPSVGPWARGGKEVRRPWAQVRGEKSVPWRRTCPGRVGCVTCSMLELPPRSSAFTGRLLKAPHPATQAEAALLRESPKTGRSKGVFVLYVSRGRKDAVPISLEGVRLSRCHVASRRGLRPPLGRQVRS